jgi:hypothetical protein
VSLRASTFAAAALIAHATAASLSAQANSGWTRPPRFQFLRGVPGTLAASGRDVVRPQNRTKVLTTLATTGIFFAFDQQIYDGTVHAGRDLNISPHHPEAALWLGSVKVFYVPTTVSSALYYLGDGWTTMMVAGSYFAVGEIRHDNRAVRTASEITESMFALGVVTQLVKHGTGRETPGNASMDRGRWRPFANLKEYAKYTPKYDAFPSGHLATAMATVTVIASNYPDNPWVKPIGYSLMGACAFSMMNDGVHWASDYPLALLIGGTVGKMAAERGHPGSLSPTASRVTSLVSPTAIGLRVRW